MRKTLSAVVGLLAAAVLTPASAAPISEWSYSTRSVFDTSATVFSSNVGPKQNTSSVLSWGRDRTTLERLFGTSLNDLWRSNNGGRSALTLGNGTTGNARYNGGTNSGTITTGVGFGLGNAITHWNRAVDARYGTLTSGSVISYLSLDAGDGSFTLPELSFSFSFNETPNNPSGSCAGGAPKPCPDIFVLAEANDFSQQFSYEGYDYLVSLFPIFSGEPGAFAELSAEECQAVGAGNVCYGFTTRESAVTTVRFGFSIAQISQIPEPGLLGLLGIALVGVVGGRRRNA